MFNRISIIRSSFTNLSINKLTTSKCSLIPINSNVSPLNSLRPVNPLMSIGPVRFATKKSGGSTQNSSGTAGKRLGLKRLGGQTVNAGEIIIRQRGTKYLPGINVLLGKDHTIHAKCDGIVVFRSFYRPFRNDKFKSQVHVLPHDADINTLNEYFRLEECRVSLFCQLKAGGAMPLKLNRRKKLLQNSEADPAVIKAHQPSNTGTPLNVYYSLEDQVNQLAKSLTRSLRLSASERNDYKLAREIMRIKKSQPPSESDVKALTEKPWTNDSLPVSIKIKQSTLTSLPLNAQTA